MRINTTILAGLLSVCLPGPLLSAQEIEWRDSLKAAQVVSSRQMQLQAGLMSSLSENLRAITSPLGEGDALRWVQSLPGVATGADGTSSFYVRGGNTGGNLLTIDGIPVYGYSHVLGITSILPTDVIESASFIKGGFGGSQGNFSSSHIALRTTTPDAGVDRKINVTLNNFLTGAGMTASVGEKGVVVASGRVSPLSQEYQAFKGLMQGGLGDLDRLGALVFDAYGKFSWRFNPRNRISVSALGSMDRYSFLTSDGSDERMGWRNFIGAVQSFHELDWGLFDLSASYNNYWSSQEQKKNFQAKDYIFLLSSALDEISLMADGFFPFGKRFTLNAGAQCRISLFNPARAVVSGSRTTATLLSAWLQGEWASKQLEVKAGARLNHFQGQGVPDFNVSTRWQPFPFLALEGTFDRISQYYHTLEGLPLGWTMDLMVPATAEMPPEQLMQGYGGLVVTYGKHQLTLGVFAREMDHLVYFKDAGDLFSGAQMAWNEAVDLGKGDARGAELLYEFSDRDFYARASATFAKATRKEFPTVNEGRPFHAPFDRRIVTNATVEWRKISLSFIYQDGNWVNGRGERYSVPLPDGEMVDLEYFSAVNNHQMPPVIRLDAAYLMEWVWGRVHNRLSLGVCNILNHFNPYTVYYDTKEGVWKEISLLPILPNFSWRIDI